MSGSWQLQDDATYRSDVVERVGDDLTIRLARIRLLVVDCDGIMTDGRLVFGPDGESLKVFDARDGLGLMMVRAVGIRRAVLTGRTSAMVERRCRDLKFEVIKMGRFNKAVTLEEIWRETGCTAAETLYMGDDLLDLPPLAAADVAVTVPDAPAEVRAVCDLVTRAGGGHGAVREVCDLILKARGDYGSSIQRVAEAGRPTDDPEVTQ